MMSQQILTIPIYPLTSQAAFDNLPSATIVEQDDETDAEDNISSNSISVLDEASHTQFSLFNEIILSPEKLQILAYKAVIDAQSPKTQLDPTKLNTPLTSPIKQNTFETPANKIIIRPHTSKEVTFVNPSTLSAHEEITKTFISPKEFRLPLKAQARKIIQKFRKRGKSIIATDTPEKDALAEKKKTASKRSIPKKVVKQAKRYLFKKKRKTQKQTVSPESSDNESFKCSGSSSGGDCFVSDVEEVDEVVVEKDFGPLPRPPKLNDYVLIHFKSKSNNIYYVARISEQLEDDDCDFYVSYLKLKSKVQEKFTEPLEPDTAGVKRLDIKYILPTPKIEGTARRKSTYKFPINMSQLNLRY